MTPRLALEWCLHFLIVVFVSIPTLVRANLEGDALSAFKQGLIDSSNVLMSWDPTLVNPCTWVHVTCNFQNNVIRVDLGNAGLAGTLVPALGQLKKLQYLELYSNNIHGFIPKELGYLPALVSLNLYQNNLKGSIPNSFGQLRALQNLRLSNNSLIGPIPMSLTAIEGLQVLDLSYNSLSGEVPTEGSFSKFVPISFVGNKLLCGSVLGIDCPEHSPSVSMEAKPMYVEPKYNNMKVIVLVGTISAAIVLVIVILGITFIVCPNLKCKRST